MSYLDWIETKHLYKKWCEYRLHHLGISLNRALRAFCLRNGFEIAMNRRQHNKFVADCIKIAKVNLYELC